MNLEVEGYAQMLGGLIESELSEVALAWLISGGVAALALGIAFVLHWTAFSLLQRITRRANDSLDQSFLRHARRPMGVIVAVLALFLVLPGLAVPDDIKVSAQRLLTLLLTASVGWLVFSLTRTINDIVAIRYDITAEDNLEARQVHTRLRILQRILATAILVITASLILMAIPGIRQIGITMFASAGIAGIVAGFAARPALSNLVAGLQLALTQPIRIDDVVIVEGEWGWIEEIGSTFVVVRIWDLRRLVVPLSHFIEHPFQNWTRRTADMLGTVYLYTDYTVPVERVRAELRRILDDAKEWDGKVWGLQVTGTSEQTLELRALMSARDSGRAWNLRCHVREKLVEFLQREYPQALPRVRAELTGDRVETRPHRRGDGPPVREARQ